MNIVKINNDVFNLTKKILSNTEEMFLQGNKIELNHIIPII